jgi:HAD superfamily hydrolase (TIGR01509 family)
MIDWKSIDSIFLDMDGTLLDLNFDNHFWQEFVPSRYAKQHRLTLAEAKRQLRPRFQTMEGRLEWYCLDYWSQALGLDILGLKREAAGLIAVLPHVADFLEAAGRAGKRLVLLTNAHPKSLELKMEKTCLQPFFDVVLSSHALRLPKEDQQFWTALQACEPFSAARTLLVDDSLAVLRSAHRAGIQHLVAMRRPDTQCAAREIDEFPAITDFRELMPVG